MDQSEWRRPLRRARTLGWRIVRRRSRPISRNCSSAARTGCERILPGGGFGKSGLLVALLIAVVVWLGSGIYIVQPDEQGVVLRFGEFVSTTTPGINYHLPWPIESVLTPQVTRENQINIGYSLDSAGNGGDVPEESLMLTGDENIVDINFSVLWVIKDAGAY